MLLLTETKAGGRDIVTITQTLIQKGVDFNLPSNENTELDDVNIIH